LYIAAVMSGLLFTENLYVNIFIQCYERNIKTACLCKWYGLNSKAVVFYGIYFNEVTQIMELSSTLRTWQEIYERLNDASPIHKLVK
jgi:hypothetical protein